MVICHSVHGGGACMVNGNMHGLRGVCGGGMHSGGACVTGVHIWQGGMHGKVGVRCRGLVRRVSLQNILRSFVTFSKKKKSDRPIKDTLVITNSCLHAKLLNEYLSAYILFYICMIICKMLIKIIEFSLNVFTEFAEFNAKNICHYIKRARTCHPTTSLRETRMLPKQQPDTCERQDL